MPTWEIYTYGNGEFLSLIFNAVVALMGDGNFVTLMRLAGIFGLFWVMTKAALYRGPVEWSYLIWFVLIYGVLFVPKVNVAIVDRLDADNTRVVANVPYGLGVFAGITAKIGDWFTRNTEAVMSLPDDLKYHKNGVVFGATLVEAASQYEITDARVAANMSEFMRQCVFYDVLFGRYSWTDLLEAEDTWTFIETNTAPNSRAFSYQYTDGTRDIFACQNGAQTVLKSDWQAEENRAASLYGKRSNPSMTMADAKAKLLADLPVSYDYLAGISRSGGDIIRANMMANAFRRGFGTAAAAADAGAAAQDFALAQAEAQQRSVYAVMGKLAAKFLPLLKNVYEGLLYGMFPFLFLVFMLPIGVKVFLVYLKNIVWLQLWAPLYAILNLLMMLHAKAASTAAAAQIGGQALSLATHSGLAAVNADTVIIAGYMGMSIPLIAYGLVSGGQMALTQMASQVAAVAQGAASQAGAAAATGNINLANLGAYNTGMFKHDTRPTMNYGGAQYTDAHGNTHTLTRDGEVFGVQRLATDIGAKFTYGQAKEYLQGTALKEAHQAAEQTATSYGSSVDSSLRDLTALANQRGQGTQSGTAFEGSEGAQLREALNRTEQVAGRIEQQHGIDKEEAHTVAHLAAAGFELGGALKVIKASYGGEKQWKDSDTEKFTNAYNDAKSAMSTLGIGNVMDLVDAWRASDSYHTAVSRDDTFRTGIDAAVGETTARREEHSASLSHVTGIEASLQRLERSGMNSDADLTGMVLNRAIALGGGEWVSRAAGRDPLAIRTFGQAMLEGRSDEELRAIMDQPLGAGWNPGNPLGAAGEAFGAEEAKHQTEQLYGEGRGRLPSGDDVKALHAGRAGEVTEQAGALPGTEPADQVRQRVEGALAAGRAELEAGRQELDDKRFEAALAGRVMKLEKYLEDLQGSTPDMSNFFANQPTSAYHRMETPQQLADTKDRLLSPDTPIEEKRALWAEIGAGLEQDSEKYANYFTGRWIDGDAVKETRAQAPGVEARGREESEFAHRTAPAPEPSPLEAYTRRTSKDGEE